MEGQIQISSSVLRTLKNTAQDRPYASVSQCHMQLEVPLNLKALGEGLVDSRKCGVNPVLESKYETSQSIDVRKCHVGTGEVTG